ncbi:unnamed protein product [Caenorhabditis brenneri]
MKMIARLTNGIYLQKGFIEGSIPPDDFISELFRFGSVTPSQFKSMNVENIQKAMHALQTFPNELQKNQNFDEIKDLFDSIKRISTEIDEIGNIRKWNEKDDFIRDIKSVASKGIDFTAVHELKDALKSWNHENEKLTGDPSKLNDHVALGALISLQGYTENMMNALKRLPSILQDVKFVTIETATVALQPILKASEEIEKLSNDVAKLQKAAHVRIDAVKDFSSFSEVAKKLNPIISHLTNIRTLVISRSIRKQELKYTHGFLDREQDILRVFRDLKDPWIQKVVNGVDFSKPLEKLEEFGGLAAKTEESLSFLDDPIVFQSFEKLQNLSNGVLEVFSKSEDFKKSMSNISKCVSIIPRKIDSATLFEFENEAVKIDGLMNQLKLNVEKLIQFSEESNAVKLLDEVLKIVKKATDLNTTVDVVKQYNMMPNSKDLMDLIKKSNLIIQEFFTPIDKSKKLEKLMMAVESKLGYLDNYHKMLKNYSTFFQCLQNIEGLESSFKTFSFIKYIRKLKTDDMGFIGSGMKVVEKISEVSKSLEDLERSIDQMQNYANVETDALKAFTNASMHSKVIGSATRGISVMKNVLDKTKLELNVSVILQQLNKVYPPLIEEDIANLNGIITLKSELFIMYNSLEEFQNNVQKQQSPQLFNHSDIFRKAEKVIGIQGNVTNMIRSVEALAERVTDINGYLEGYIGWSIFLLVVLGSVAALSYASYVFMCKKKSARKTRKRKEDVEE